MAKLRKKNKWGFPPIVLGMLLVFGLSTMMIMGATLPGGSLDSRSSAHQVQPATADDIVCAEIYQPVCGTDGQTYGNGCYALRAGAEVECENECPCLNLNEIERY